MPEGVSVIICCYNSADRIGCTLEYIASQQLPARVGFQLVIVDNASTDDTVNVVKKKWTGLNPTNIDLVIAQESKQGLSYARKKGLSCVAYDYIVFCDDDNWLDKNYLANVYNFFRINSDVVIVGGAGEPVFNDGTMVPAWFEGFKDNYATGKQADHSNNEMQGVYGAGLAIQKKLILDRKFISLPHLLEGRKAGKLSAGEDSELCLKAQLLGYKVGYLEDLKFKHYIPASRLTWDYFKELHRGFARSYIAIHTYQKVLGKKKVTAFSWLEELFYFTGIYFKYWPRQYLKYRNTEGTVEEIRHITWGIIAKSYLQYNFKTLRLYRQITKV